MEIFLGYLAVCLGITFAIQIFITTFQIFTYQSIKKQIPDANWRKLKRRLIGYIFLDAIDRLKILDGSSERYQKFWIFVALPWGIIFPLYGAVIFAPIWLTVWTFYGLVISKRKLDNYLMEKA